MAKFSKQHYQAVASLLYDQRNHALGMLNRESVKQNLAEDYWRGAVACVESLAVHFSAIFDQDNEQFVPEHFFAVVRGEPTVKD